VDFSLIGITVTSADEEGRAFAAWSDSCRLRRAGFEEAAISDVTRYGKQGHRQINDR